MMAVSSQMLRDSAVYLTEGAHTFLRALYSDIGFGLMREDAVVQWENQLGITPAPTDTLTDRQMAVEEAWGSMVGAQGPGYLQAQLQRAGFDVVVTENLPVADLAAGLGLTFSTSLSCTTDNSVLCMGQNSSGYLLGNGVLSEWGDPIETPGPGTGTSAATFSSDTLTCSATTTVASMGDDVNRWGYVFIIEGEGGVFADIPSQSRTRFEETIIKLKPAHTGVLLRVNYT